MNGMDKEGNVRFTIWSEKLLIECSKESNLINKLQQQIL